MPPTVQNNQLSLYIVSETDITSAYLRAGPFLLEIGFNETQKALILTALSELSRNVLKYAVRGEARLTRLQRVSRSGVEMVVIDHGPGIADIEKALQDHYSSSGTLGLGLPGVKRMMDDFTIDSTVGQGTRITVRKWV